MPTRPRSDSQKTPGPMFGVGLGSWPIDVTLAAVPSAERLTRTR